ncbi:MAG TPA: VOC family protein [Actinoplanes sp.]|nr:VOC family protein [Actinoplanes sp.]
MTEEPKDRSAPSGDTAYASPPVISVMLIVPDAEAAVAWYKAALGATELWNLGGVAGLEISGAPFFLHEVSPANLTETSPGQAGVTSTRIEVFADDPDNVIERAVAAGAIAGAGIEDHRAPWGTHRQGGFTDPFGHKWSVGDKSPLRPFPR